MFNPFLQPLPTEKRRHNPATNGDFPAEFYGHSLDTSSPRPSVGLWIGRLLIKMGEKLAKQDVELKTTRETS